MKTPRVAIFPVGGLGTRFLPFTKSVPMELLPLNGRPIIEYAVSEARKAGIERIVFVNSPAKPQLEDHFRSQPELEGELFITGRHEELEKVVATDLGDRLHVVHQDRPLGIGHAVLCARQFVFNEPFAVILPDDFIHADRPVLKQMIEAYQQRPGNYVATHDVGVGAINNYGSLDIAEDDGKVLSLKNIVEKPDPLEAPSTYAVVGRYILQPEVLKTLSTARPKANGRIELTDAIATQKDLFAYRFDGSHYDCGQPAGYAAANIYMTTCKTKSRILPNTLRTARVSGMPVLNMG
ncbi:MAG: sugar phosphate nucleotidyltransferase [Pseudomonadota bacterium]